jgi:TPR repeat protein
MYAEGMGVKRNAARAAELYRKTCEVGGAAACLKLRFSYANGTGVKQDNFGLIMYAERMGVKRNAARAAEVYRKACEGGSPGVCDNYEELKKQKAHQDTGG